MGTATHAALARFANRHPILYHGSRGGIAGDIIAYCQLQREEAERELERIKLDYRNRGELLVELVTESSADPAAEHDGVVSN